MKSHREVRRNIVLFTVSGIILLGTIFVIVQFGRVNRPVKIGDVAPNIQESTISGQSFSLDSLRGKPVMLNFFTPWCQPCIDETPDLIQFAKKYGNDIQVVMLDRGDAPVLVQRFVSQYHVPAAIAVLSNPKDKWSTQFGVTGQPETIFITPGGKVVRHVIGPLTESQMLSDAKVAGLR